MINQTSKVSSRITLDVIGVNGHVRHTLKFQNIMTNHGLDSWTKGALGTHIALGSGSRTELPSVTDLAGFVRTDTGSYTYTNTNFVDEANGVMRSDHVLNVTFPIESSAQNYSELGIHNNNPNELQTYARIRDPIGEPTSVGVQVGERVRVSYVVQFSTALVSVEQGLIGGVLTDITTIPLATGATNAIRLPNAISSAVRFWAAGQDIPSAGVAPTGGVATPTTPFINNGSYVLSAQLVELNLTGGISLVRMGGTSNNVGIMCHFDPPINKNDKNSLAINVTCSLSNGVFYA